MGPTFWGCQVLRLVITLPQIWLNTAADSIKRWRLAELLLSREEKISLLVLARFLAKTSFWASNGNSNGTACGTACGATGVIGRGTCGQTPCWTHDPTASGLFVGGSERRLIVHMNCVHSNASKACRVCSQFCGRRRSRICEGSWSWMVGDVAVGFAVGFAVGASVGLFMGLAVELMVGFAVGPGVAKFQDWLLHCLRAG